MSRKRNIPDSTSVLGGPAQQPKLVPSVQPLLVGDRNQEDQDQGRSTKPSAVTKRPPRRRGRPRGPERVAMTVRILKSTDRKLTVAVEETGLNPQSIVEDALEAYFRRLKIQDPGAETGKESAS